MDNLPAVLAAKLALAGLLAVASSMANLFAVVALNDNALSAFNLFLLAGATLMPNLAAVAASSQSIGDRLAGIVETIQDVLQTLGPALLLTRASGFVGEAIRDAILLVQVALEIHVGQSPDDVLFERDEEEVHLLPLEGGLELAVSHIGILLNVFLNGSLAVVDIAVLDGFSELFPGLLSRDVGDIGSVDATGVRAFVDEMT